MRSCYLLLAVLTSVAVVEAQPTPAGRWKTFDDATGKAKSIVLLWEDGGRIYGKIEKVLNPSPDNPKQQCIHCVGALNGKPLVGLQILSGLKKDGEQWSGGKILDPDNGKFYKCFIAVQEGGKTLKVRGFIGISLLGRTQYWLREE